MKKDRLHALSFALVETALYLDGHPKDKRALEYYEKVSKEYKAELKAGVMAKKEKLETVGYREY